MSGAARYSTVAIILHWLMALMLVGMVAAGWTMVSDLVTPATKFQLYQLHKSTGIMILLLTIIRLGWRLTHRPPALPNNLKSWERMAAKTVHIGFYVLMVLIPLSGWAVVSASTLGIPTIVYGLFEWPHMPWLTDLPNQSEMEDLTKEIHEKFVYAIIFLFLMHVGAAIKHHFVLHDDVLSRMLPFLRK